MTALQPSRRCPSCSDSLPRLRRHLPRMHLRTINMSAFLVSTSLSFFMQCCPLRPEGKLEEFSAVSGNSISSQSQRLFNTLSLPWRLIPKHKAPLTLVGAAEDLLRLHTLLYIYNIHCACCLCRTYSGLPSHLSYTYVGYLCGCSSYIPYIRVFAITVFECRALTPLCKISSLYFDVYSSRFIVPRKALYQ